MSWASLTWPGKQASLSQAYLRSIAYASLAPTEISGFVRMKFGTWVKPCRVTGSAPMISMLRSLRISPMWRSDRESTLSLYAHHARRFQLSPLRGIGRCVGRPTEERRQHFLKAGDEVVRLAGSLGQVL